MNLHFIKYSATGNNIGVAHYSDIFHIEDFVNDLEARKNLKGLALQNLCDSVMILVKNREAILQTIVFEPNSESEHGAFSTMCGNGVRAVAKYAEEYLKFLDWPLSLSTRSGMLSIEKSDENKYRVLMGKIVLEKIALGSYVNYRYFPKKSELENIDIPYLLLEKINTLDFGPRGAVCSIGFSTTETDINKADGEPHMTIELDSSHVKNIRELRIIAQKYGPAICDNKEIFPLRMNVNFVIPNKGEKSFLVCTYERNLGNDPKKSVTQACGTGCTFAGSEQMEKFKTGKVVAQCLGGDLIVEKINDLVYMSGKVKKI